MRILLAITEPNEARRLRMAVQNDSTTVESAADLEDLQKRAAAVVYDALVVDLDYPGAGGVAAIKRLRRSGISAPILALTGTTAPETRVQALHFGADDCMVKPVLPQELAARVHALARRAGRRLGECLEVEDLVLYLPQRLAYRAGKALGLTNREFAALERLVRAHGQPVTSAELQELLWHEDEPPRDNFVAVLMMRLRKKVDDGFPAKLLKTLRGTGYLVAPASE